MVNRIQGAALAAIAFLVSSFLPIIAQASDMLYTPDTNLVKHWKAEADYNLLGDAFRYETGLGRVEIKSKGQSFGVSVRLMHNTEFDYSHMDFDIDSYFAGSLVGTTDTDANLLKLKSVINEHSIHPIGLEYKYLDNTSISGIHFADIFMSMKGPQSEFTGGLSSYFGSGVDDRVGVFANAKYIATDGTVELFVEYSTADFLKAFQNNLIAPTAVNLGTVNVSNAPKDAFSMGIHWKPGQGLDVMFAVYDLDVQMKPVIGISLEQ